jgi:hypothetical protein
MEEARSRDSGPPVLAGIRRENEAVRARLLASVGGLSEKQVAFRPAPGKWSIGEVLDHLCLAERSMTRTISRLLQQAAGFGMIGLPDSMEEPRHTVDLEAFSRPVLAPDAVLPSPDRPLARLLADLQESRERLQEVCARVEGRVVGPIQLVHFQLGHLNFYQWLAVVGAHDAKHLRQIAEITAHPEFPAA